jgi:hypothetical protein
MIRPDDLNWRVFCEVMRKESGHDPCLYEYALPGRYWAECSKCHRGLAHSFETVSEAAAKWRSGDLYRIRCRG